MFWEQPSGDLAWFGQGMMLKVQLLSSTRRFIKIEGNSSLKDE